MHFFFSFFFSAKEPTSLFATHCREEWVEWIWDLRSERWLQCCMIGISFRGLIDGRRAVARGRNLAQQKHLISKAGHEPTKHMCRAQAKPKSWVCARGAQFFLLPVCFFNFSDQVALLLSSGWRYHPMGIVIVSACVRAFQNGGFCFSEEGTVIPLHLSDLPFAYYIHVA